MEVFQASSEHLKEVSKLFDQYRVFYNLSSDYEAAREFLKERFEKEDSTIFAASVDRRIVGFAQLYPSFSSLSMKHISILNDLFVNEGYRGQGVAKSLMSAAENFARETKCVQIVLATQISNIAAQSLYESCGYAKDEEFYNYTLRL
jgi:ribosomal protein S18 acetylase RimI-like enzyme